MRQTILKTLSFGLLIIAFGRALSVSPARAADSTSASPLRLVSPSDCLPAPTDYTLAWWAGGFNDRPVPQSAAQSAARKGAPKARKAAPPPAGNPHILNIRTGSWAMAFDMENVRILKLGPLAPASAVRAYAEAAAEGDAALAPLPAAAPDLLALTVTVGGQEYHCVRGGVAPDASGGWRKQYPYRLIESGRWVQRFDIQGLVFESANHERLNATGRLEITAWPNRLTFRCELTPNEPLPQATVVMTLNRSLRRATVKRSGDFEKSQKIDILQAIEPAQAPEAPDTPFASGQIITSAPIENDLVRACRTIKLPFANFRPEDFNRLDRLRLRLENPDDTPRAFPLGFTFDAPGFPVVGLTPMLRDAAGNPTGLPIQISKNWHRTEGLTLLYQGPWFHGYTLLRLPAHSKVECEFALTYAGWGGLPAVSHAQLCLIGWGGNQLWDQVAIGSWGESICYDPETGQGRSFIDDVRPLLVSSMNGGKERGWTNNVGGGDFLVYFDAQGRRQYLSGARTAYLAQGPNLTRTRYTATTADGAIAARIDVSTPRTDDVNRAFHHFRYDVLKETPFTRLAFYQLGADRYNDHSFGALARGNEGGLIEQWTPAKRTLQYERQGIACPGKVPWFALLEGAPRKPLTDQSAWADRGLVVRSWRARLGGKEVKEPCAAVFGTNNGVASANVELAPPSGLTRLVPGDFVEAEVELLIVPQTAADYRGPNANLRASLASAGAEHWRPVARLAQKNNLEVKALHGTLEHTYPIAVKADAGRAALEVTGGVGYIPLTVTGLPDFKNYTLWKTAAGKREAVDQAVHGGDFWQTEYNPATRTWSLTYNIGLDTPGDAPQTVKLELEAARL